MKNVLLILALTLVATLNLFSQTATAPTAGDGTAGNPYQIATLDNLYWIAADDSIVASPNREARWSSYYIQTADIDASATFSWFSGAAWIPIGNETTQFTGSYNGQNHTISNLWINRPTENYVGFFGYTSTATISNLNIVNFNYIGSACCGGFAGYIIHGTVSNCSSSGFAMAISYDTPIIYGGGFAGRIFFSTISNCISSGMSTATAHGIECEAHSGGFAGYIYYGTISNCSSSAATTATMNSEYACSGGFAGYILYATTSNCSSSGTATASATANSLFGYSYALSGGFAGAISGGTTSNCSSSGAATATNPLSYAAGGGFVGTVNEGAINMCYSIGSISVAGYFSMYIGGFVGLNVNGTIANSYFCNDIYPISNDGTGLSSIQMKNFISFVGWDFTNTWKMTRNSSQYQGFPVLRWIEDSGPYGEITLKGNEIEIVNSDNTPSVSDFTNFGSAITNNETISRTFEIVNTNTADLNINSTSPYVSISGPNASEFSITKIPSTTISQNGNTIFRVAYTPTSAGNHSAIVNFSSNDDDEGNYTFSIQGTGVSTPSIQSNNISFSNISQTGMTVSWNRGNGDKTLLLGKQSYRIDDSPLSNGTTYPANSASFTDPLNATADCAKVLYNGSSLNPSVNITNLTRYKLYYFKVAEFNEVRENDDNITLYNQSESSNNPRSRWTLRKEDGTEYEPSEFVYPNPATNEINCEVIINETSDIRLDIYSMDSRLVKKINFGRYREGNAKLTADIADLTSGTYLVIYHIGDESFVALIDVVK